MRALNDPALVREQYADEEDLRARKAIYATAEGPDARELAFAAVAEVAPATVLEVGGGEGELAERIVRHELLGNLLGKRRIKTARDVDRLAAAGYDAFLVGESLLRQNDRAAAVRKLRGEGER